jgi:hypothetical protein
MDKFNEDEYKHVRYRRVRPDRKIVIFAVGNILGILFFYIFGGRGIALEGEFWSSTFGINDNTGLFQYIFSLRIKQMLFLTLCSYSYFGNILAYGVLGGLGFEFGIIFLTFVYNYKFKGILLSMVMLLPQGIFYFLLVVLIFERFYYDDTTSPYNSRIVLLWKSVMAIALLLLGFLCESCINYDLVKKIVGIN